MKNKKSQQDDKICISPFVSNLFALRKTVLLSLLGIAVCIAALAPFTNLLFDEATKPLLSSLPQGSRMLAVGVVSPVLGPLKVLLFCAFVLSLPFTLYMIWSFVSPALYKHEKEPLCLLSCHQWSCLQQVPCTAILWSLERSFHLSLLLPQRQ